MTKFPKKGENVRSKNYERKIKPQFMIYGNFESILVLEGNEKHNPNTFYKQKYQKHVAFSYNLKLGYDDDTF